MTETTADLAIRYGAAWAAHDPDAIVALHTDDTVFHMHGGGDPVQGRPAVREAIVVTSRKRPTCGSIARRSTSGTVTSSPSTRCAAQPRACRSRAMV